MKIRSAAFTADGRIDCEVNHAQLGWIPYTADKSDPTSAAIFEAALALVPAEYVAPPLPDPLEAERAGMVASRFQTRAALYLAGLLPQVEAMIGKADPLTQMAWAEAVEFRRSSPTIAALAAGLGLDAMTLDALFRTAAGIEV